MRFADAQHRRTFDFFLMTHPMTYWSIDGERRMTYRFKRRNRRKRIRFSDYDVLRVTSLTLVVRPKEWRQFAKKQLTLSTRGR